jgi:hypothetical protein
MNYLLTTFLYTFLACHAGCTPPAQQPNQTGITTPKSETQTASAPSPNLKSAIPNLQSPDLTKFALIISGISGEEAYAKQFDKWMSDLRATMIERLAFAPDHISMLNEKGVNGATKASAEEVRKAFAGLRNAVKADSRVFIFFIGHGTFADKVSKFNLPGPDLSAEDYAALLKNFPTRNLVIINTTSASGDFIKPLSAQGRVIVTATRSGMEQNATRFAEYFIAALSGRKGEEVRADAEASSVEADADKNGRVSVLEAFDYSVRLVNDFFKQEGRLVTEHALLDDNGDGVGHEKPEAGDGALAKTTYFDSLPAQLAGGDEELKKLFADKARLESEVEQLKARKDQMKAEEYEAGLEKLLIELAQVNQKIKAKQQK